jgi:hypothetical protein
MFGRKKCPVLTATTCKKMEDARQSMEVFTGKRVRFVQFDFNTGYGKARIGEDERDVAIDFPREDLVIWRFTDVKEWYRSFFEPTGEVEVICDENPHKRGRHIMYWCGKSATERYEKPVFLEDLRRCAEIGGMTLEEYMNLE